MWTFPNRYRVNPSYLCISENNSINKGKKRDSQNMIKT